MFYLVRILTGLVLFFISQSGIGSTVSGALSVTATVGGGGHCVLTSASAMIFPNYNPMSPNSDNATGSVVVTCPKGMPYDVGANQGDGVGSTEDRRMATDMPGKEELSYGIFQDSNRQRNLGDIMGEDTMSEMGTGLAQVITLYGRIPAHQMMEVGAYSDLVTIIITF